MSEKTFLDLLIYYQTTPEELAQACRIERDEARRLVRAADERQRIACQKLLAAVFRGEGPRWA
jgi:hypothetical protein